MKKGKSCYVFKIALRYLISRNQKSVINTISWISLIGIAVCTTALILVLSVYNGIGDLTQSLFNVFDPELIIEPQKGKTLHVNDIELDKIHTINDIDGISEIVEEKCWISCLDKQAIATLRGVSKDYGKLIGLDTMIYEGHYLLYDSTSYNIPIHYAIIGANIYYSQLGLGSTNNTPITLRIPHRQGNIGHSIEQAFNTTYVYPSGSFMIQEDIDNKYVVCSSNVVRQLMDYDKDECTALCIHVNKKGDVQKIKKSIEKILNNNYVVKDRFEQQPIYYKIYKGERFGIILILSLIIIIASLSLTASLSLLIIDKQQDIYTLRSLGMSNKFIHRVFFIEGELISCLGVTTGLIVGFIICIIQQQFGIIKMGAGFIVSAFPVALRYEDFILSFVLVLFITSIAISGVTYYHFGRHYVKN